jgi:thiol:disulfide interchange protein
MKRLLWPISVLLFTLAAFQPYALPQDARTDSQSRSGARAYVPVHAYDPARNARQDILDAQVEAKRTGRNVLIEVGGTWCVWCRTMNKFFEEHADLAQLRDQNYVLVTVNWSKENENKAVLSQYPAIGGYPHIFVVDAGGKLLHSEDTSELEEAKGYNAEKVREFLLKWVPAKEHS